MCLFPKTLSVMHRGKPLTVPCGRCVDCVKTETNKWAFRILHESKNSYYPSHFVTLTYQDELLPLKIIEDTPYPQLDYDHLRSYIKRVREKHKYDTGQTIKYFAVGEYGDKFRRPHYHIIFINVKKGYDFSEQWSLGITHQGLLNENGVFYTLKYAFKKRLVTLPEFYEPMKSYKSKGLGKSFLTPEIVQKIRENPHIQINFDGNSCQIPKYFLDKVLDDEMKEIRYDKLMELKLKSDKELEYKMKLEGININTIKLRKIEKENRIKKITLNI